MVLATGGPIPRPTGEVKAEGVIVTKFFEYHVCRRGVDEVGAWRWVAVFGRDNDKVGDPNIF